MLKQQFSFTAYAVNSYLVPGPKANGLLHGGERFSIGGHLVSKGGGREAGGPRSETRGRKSKAQGKAGGQVMDEGDNADSDDEFVKKKRRKKPDSDLP